MTAMTIGQRIRARREELGLTQEELAKKVGYKSKTSINKIEIGSYNLTQNKIKAISDALRTTPSYIMGWDDDSEIKAIRAASTAERLQQIMEERNLKQVDVLDLAQPYCKKYGVTLGKTALSQYTTGKFEPGKSKLTVLSLALNVSEAWLRGYDVPQKRELTFADESNSIYEDFVELFSRLTIEQQSFIVSAMKGLLSDK